MTPIAQQAYLDHLAAIDAELHRLVSDGVAVERIVLEHHPGMVTRVTVDGIPIAQFTITMDGGAPL